MGFLIINKGLRNLIVITLFTLIGIVFCNKLFFEDQIEFSERRDNLILRKNFAMRVDSMFLDRPNHNYPTLINKNGQEIALPRLFYDQIEIGDSINKRKGDYFIRLIKPDGSLVTLDYIDVFNSEIILR